MLNLKFVQVTLIVVKVKCNLLDRVCDKMIKIQYNRYNR